MTLPALLLVDDEADILSALKELFEGREFHVLTAVDAEEALLKFKKNDIAVIVTDNHMPGMRGVHLLSMVKEISPDTVRILMTGYADLDTALEAINSGEVFRFLTKPCKNKEILETVREGVGRYTLLKTLKRTDEATLLSLARTIELKDHYTRGHCDRVAGYALRMAGKLNFSDEEKLNIKYGCWLHDCGKIGVPEMILNKKGPLDQYDLSVLRKHPRWGADVARQARLHPMIVNIIMSHHENFDGGGYPDGLAGVQIPLEARIVAVADKYDALSTDRPYRKGFSKAGALQKLAAMKSAELDPDLVNLFINSCDCQDYDAAIHF